MKKNHILLLMLFIGHLAFCQEDMAIQGKSIPELWQVKNQDFVIPNSHLFINYKEAMNTPPVALLPFFKQTPYHPTPSMPKAWTYEHLAFFCKLEVQMEKITQLPIKVRLGEVQEVERMEGKY